MRGGATDADGGRDEELHSERARGCKIYKIWNEELGVRNGVNLGLYRQSGDIDV